MSENVEHSVRERWARLRFAVIGPLLVAPPESGELRMALGALAAKSWRHPVSGESVRFALSTIERWYYIAKRGDGDPVAALRSRRRADAGRHRRLCEALRQALRVQYRVPRGWFPGRGISCKG